MTDFFDIAQKLSGVSTPVLLFLILYGGYKRVWVFGYQLEKAESDAQQWKEMALHATGIAETSVSIAKTTRQG